MTELNPQELERLRRHGGLLLGSLHRLPLAVATSQADPDELYAARLARAVRTQPKDAGRALEDLRRAGVLSRSRSRIQLDRGQPAIGYERREHPFWECVEILRADARTRRLPRD